MPILLCGGVLFLVSGFMSCEIVLLQTGGSFYIGVFEKVCDFSNVWEHICESRPSGVASGFCE